MNWKAGMWKKSTLVILQSSIEKTNHVHVTMSLDENPWCVSFLSNTQRPYFFVIFLLSPDDPTYFCIFLSLNAKNHALTQWPLIFWACALTECPQPVWARPLHPYPFHIWLPPPIKCSNEALVKGDLTSIASTLVVSSSAENFKINQHLHFSAYQYVFIYVFFCEQHRPPSSPIVSHKPHMTVMCIYWCWLWRKRKLRISMQSLPMPTLLMIWKSLLFVLFCFVLLCF